MASAANYATGRRKSAVARVWLKPGNGTIIINNKPINEYFRRQTLELVVRQPLEEVGVLNSFDVVATVDGGGWTGQAGAVKLGIARCLAALDEKYKNPCGRQDSLPGIHVRLNAKNMARKRHGKDSSFPNDKKWNAVFTLQKGCPVASFLLYLMNIFGVLCNDYTGY